MPQDGGKSPSPPGDSALTSTAATATATTTTTSASKHSYGLHLACRECQRKKVKCDRTFPCGQCSRANLACVPSSRKPRVKAGTRAADAELRQRIAKLERLVETFHADDDAKDSSALSLPPTHGDAKQPSPASSSSSPPPPSRGPAASSLSGSSGSPSMQVDSTSTASTRANRYVAGSFWSSLTTEVKALADALDEDALQSDDDGTSPELSPPSAPDALDPMQLGAAGYELLFCPPGVLYVMPGALQDPPPEMAAQLLELYLDHVEPLPKMCHAPSIRDFVQHGAPYLGRPADAPCNKALKAAVYFAAVNTLQDDECRARYGKSLKELVRPFRASIDIALYQADPLNTTELATLQALVMYAGAVRVLDSSRRAWSIVGLLVRLARAMNMHREYPEEPPFLREIRRRIWYSIVFLDCYASIDRGSESAMHPDTFTRPLPSNCNDDDFNHDSLMVPDREGEITDMSLSLIAFHGSFLSLQMILPGLSWQQRLEKAYEFQRWSTERFLRYCNPDVMFHRAMMGTGTAACHSMILRAVRPVNHETATTSAPPRVDSPWVMQLALNILRHASELWLYKPHWRRMPWVPWHAIAVALAGLCSVRGTAMAEEAWSLVDVSMAHYKEDVADSKNGMLWRPIEKLYKKAAAFRDVDPQQQQQQQQQQPQILQEPAGMPAQLSLDGMPMQQAMPLTPGSMMLDPLSMPLSDSVFDFPPDMHASLPMDTSWLDWEGILKDMDEIKADDMQWMQ